MYFPARNPRVPTSSCGSTCSPTHGPHVVALERLFGQHQRGSARIALLARLEQPEERAAEIGASAKVFSTPNSTAACMSWPQACITPSFCESPLAVVPLRDGRASMSARSTAARGRLRGRLCGPSMLARRPSAIGRCSMPSSVSCGSMNAAVACSLNDSSGCACRRRRNWTGIPLFS